MQVCGQGTRQGASVQSLQAQRVVGPAEAPIVCIEVG
jgi:hypothetical protein